MKNSSHYSIITFFLLVLLSFIWGIDYSIARYITINGNSPLGCSLLQSLGSTILLYLFIKLKGMQLKLYNWKYYLVTGVLGIAIPNTNVYFIAPHLQAGTLSAIVNTMPIIIYPLALFANQEQFCWTRLFGVILGFLGILAIIIPCINLTELHITYWSCLSLLTPLSLAIAVIYINKHRPSDSNSLALSTGMLLAASICLLPIALGLKQFNPLKLSFELSGWIILLKTILSSIGYVILFELLKRASPVYYSLTGCITVLTGLFWGKIFFNEHLSLNLIISISLIIIAILLITTYEDKTKDEKDI